MASGIFLLALRRLRAPLIALVVVFAISILGLVLIPGRHPDGSAWHMSISQALYFTTYTATTIGFGEIPHPFNDAQRLWVTGMIFASVIGWAYLVTSLIRLANDRAFRGAVNWARFRREVAAVDGPFYLVCGIGETGALVCRALDTLGYRFVAIDIREQPIQALDLMGLHQDPPALVADARLPENLIAAGLPRDNCRGVLSLTNNDQVNLAVAMSVRLLNPDTPVLARAMSRETAANMASFNTDHIVNPFATFGMALALAIASPASYQLLTWLAGLPGTTLKPETAPPRGHWVVCGYGRFGKEVVRALQREGLDLTVVDPEPLDMEHLEAVLGEGTEAGPLKAAGIEHAVGIVAGTDDDVTNLSIAVTAHELKKELFIIVRQNERANDALFDAFDADITMISHELIANECLALINTPLLARFLRVIREGDEAWADALLQRLMKAVGSRTPQIWSVRISASGAPALHRALMMDKMELRLGDLARQPANRDEFLAIVPLYLCRRDAEDIVLPADDTTLVAGDEVLFAGTVDARNRQWPLLRNVNVRDYVLTGYDAPGGWIWQRLAKKKSA